LTFFDNNLYGTTPTPTIQDAAGTLFNIRSDGANFGNLYVFSGSDGAYPRGPLGLSVDPLFGRTLYGTTSAGGDFGQGIVFSFNESLVPLHHFSGGDGGNPRGVLASDNTLYGTTQLGGSLGRGTVYAVNIDGTDFRILYNFGTPTNTEGIYPNPGLTLSGNILYGTARSGGTGGQGTVFKVNVDGTGFAVLHTFTALLAVTNSDGVNPNGELCLSSNTLYGTTALGGSWGNGTVFKVGTDGTGFATLYNFMGGTDGVTPNGGLVIAGNVLYGTTSGRGDANVTVYGTVFSLSESPPVPGPPRLTISRSGPNVILGWPTSMNGFSYAGYTLQTATDLTSGNWTTNLPPPVIVNGQYTVPNPINGAEQFFRLSQ